MALRTALALLAAALLAPLPVAAQTSTAAVSRVLTWADCVHVALENSPDLTASQRAVLAGQASYRSSFNGLLPRLSLTNGYSDSNGASGNSRWSLGGALSMDLFDLGQVAGIKFSEAAYGLAQASLRATSASVRFGLLTAFAQLLFAQRAVDVDALIRDIRKRDADMVSLRYASGQESKGNMDRAKAQDYQAEEELVQARRSVRLAQTSLDRQLGLDEFDAVAATGALLSPPPPGLAEDLERLADQRPDVAVQRAALDSARAGLEQARAPLFPTVSATYTRSRTGGSELPSRSYDWTAGGVLSYPLFGGGPTSAYFNVQAGKRTVEKAEEQLRAVRDAALLDLQSTWTSYAGAFDQVEVQRRLLDAARQRADEADVMYASGLLSYDNWEIIVSDRVSQERQSLQSQLAGVQTEAAWQQALGVALGE